MAIPAVEVLLRRLPGAAFAAQPRPKPSDEPCVRTNGIVCPQHGVEHGREGGAS